MRLARRRKGEMANKYAKLQQQFLCCYPVNKMSWSSLSLPLDLAEQEALIAATCGHPLNQRYPVRRSYQEAFVKRLLQLLEDHDELHDDLYDSLLTNPAVVAGNGYAYKHYLLQADAQITLRESNSFVNEGTTGLCTWEAALALADYLLQHSELIKGKNIMELGAGAGLLGILLKQPALKLQVGQVVLTDGSAPCVKLMRENISMNFPNAIADVESIPQSEQLRWDEIKDFPWKNYAETDLLMAADIIYDDSQFDALLNALDYVYARRGSHLEMLMASTVRNMETLNKFMEQLDLHHYQVTPCANVSAAASRFCRDHTAAVQIILISR